MIYRRFGRTGLDMPVFSCGGMRYQDGWKDKPLDEVAQETQVNLEATIRRSIEVGMNHIETARGYGPSERQLGLVLPTFPRDQIIAQTKVNPKADADEFLADFNDSLERLQLDYVDLLGVHGINNEETFEWATKPGGCLAAARKLQEQGKVRHVGFSTHGPTDIIVKTIEHDDGRGGFDYVNLHWYFVFQRNWPAIEAATRNDMGVFIISPSDKGGKLYAPPDKLVELCQPLHPIVFNDLFCLSHEQVHTLSVGAARPSDFDLHLETLPLLERSDAVLAPIVEQLRDAMEAETGYRDPEAMGRGLPAWEQGPGKLNLENILWLRHLAVGWDLTDYATMRFNLMGDGGHWFPGAKPTEMVDQITEAEWTSTLGDHPRAADIPALVRETCELLGGEAVQRESAG